MKLLARTNKWYFQAGFDFFCFSLNSWRYWPATMAENNAPATHKFERAKKYLDQPQGTQCGLPFGDLPVVASIVNRVLEGPASVNLEIYISLIRSNYHD
jgi:hypothetical protein